MKNSHKNNPYKNIAQIIERLPLHRQLKETQAMLVKITPIWLDWSANHLSKKANAARPIDISNGTLELNCFDSVEASQIKHQQTSLINALHKAGFNNIECIKLRMSLPRYANKHEDMQQAFDTEVQSNKQRGPIIPSTQSIRSIERCGQLTDNAQLSESLQRLVNTLNKTL